jgi:hypothetical protein
MPMRRRAEQILAETLMRNADLVMPKGAGQAQRGCDSSICMAIYLGNAPTNTRRSAAGA